MRIGRLRIDLGLLVEEGLLQRVQLTTLVAHALSRRHALGEPLQGDDAGTVEAAGITFVTTKHETAAGFMAEAVWQRTGVTVSDQTIRNYAARAAA